MNLAIVYTRAQVGMHALSIAVEAHISNGIPAFIIVGLPETVVKESKERVRSAILNSGFEFPDGRITINLAPADLPKEGGRFDLPIALGILLASAQIKTSLLDEYEFAGELALNGGLRPIQAALPFAHASQMAQKSLILPQKNAEEASLIQNAFLYPASHLLAVCSHLQGIEHLPLQTSSLPVLSDPPSSKPDLSDVVGQESAKRALIIAAAGGHHLLMQGPPGTGKTMLASRLSGLLPPMSNTEAIESASLYSIRGHAPSHGFAERPFRSPHHTSSGIALGPVTK